MPRIRLFCPYDQVPFRPYLIDLEEDVERTFRLAATECIYGSNLSAGVGAAPYPELLDETTSRGIQ